MVERLLAQICPNEPIGVGLIKIWSTRPGMLDSDQIISGTLCIWLPACWGKEIIRSHSKWDLVLTHAFLLNHFHFYVSAFCICILPRRVLRTVYHRVH